MELQSNASYSVMHNSTRISSAVSFYVPLTGENFSPADEYPNRVQMFRQQSMTYATTAEYLVQCNA